jgi:hypothetical protein
MIWALPALLPDEIAASSFPAGPCCKDIASNQHQPAWRVYAAEPDNVTTVEGFPKPRNQAEWESDDANA